MTERPAGTASWLAALKFALTALFLALGCYYVWSRKDEFLAVQWPSLYAMAVVALALVANVWLRSTYNLITARKLGSGMTAGESFMLSAVVSAGNFILPAKLGAGLRAMYMKKVHDFPISYFMSGVLIFMVATVFLVSIVALAVLAIIYGSIGYVRLDLVLLFPIVMVVTLAMLLLLRAPATGGGEHPTWIGSFRSSFTIIVTEKRLVAAALVIVAASFVASAFAWTVALREASPEIAVAEASLLAASQIITGFITLTPGAAGFQELAGMYVGKSFDVAMTQIFAVMVWVRVVRIAVSVGLAMPSLWILRGRLAKAISTSRAIDAKTGARET